MSSTPIPKTESPCISVCKVKEFPNGDRICLGCYRTTREIKAWTSASPEQQKKILWNTYWRDLAINAEGVDYL
jgi:uncharacterized protein